MKYTLTCQTCNTEFEVTSYEVKTGRKYCSRDCSRVKKQVNLTCQTCSKEFQVPPSYAKKGAKFCSFECRNKSMQVEKVCEVCGKLYIVPKRYSDSKYCSQKCSHEAQKDQILRICQQCGKEEYIQRANGHRPFCSWKCKVKSQEKEKVKIECVMCGKEFKTHESRAKQNAKYCSHECKTKDFMENFHGIWQKSKFPRKDLHDITFRSTWEANYARILEYENIDWEFEKHYLKLSDGRLYLPDFFLPDENRFIEIKGWWNPKSLEKFKKIKKEYSHLIIDVIDKPQYKELEKKYKHLISNWE